MKRIFKLFWIGLLLGGLGFGCSQHQGRAIRNQDNRDTQSEKIIIPGWLRYIPYAVVLQIQAPDSQSIRIDFGQNVIDTLDMRDGIQQKQIYYLLSQMEIPAGDTASVYAVCGGSGSTLTRGRLVTPSLRVSKQLAKEIGTIVVTIESNYVDAKANDNKERLEAVAALAQYLREAIIRSVQEDIKRVFEG